jgi:hypothetical protein
MEFRIEKKEELAKILMSTKETVLRVAKLTATDVSPVCCDSRGDWMIFIGLSGKAINYRGNPKGNVRLPADLIALYDQRMTVYSDAVRRGVAGEDRSKGYALSVDPASRNLELKMREYALKQEPLVREVLENSSDPKHRSTAAQILGYAEQSIEQMRALVGAAKDSDSTVRNNATRALAVLVQSNPKLATEVPADFYVDLLLSGQWSDLNKACMLLMVATHGRDEALISPLRRTDVLQRLIEISRWLKGYAEPAQYLLGRIAGIPEDRLKQLVASGNTEEILSSLKR